MRDAAVTRTPIASFTLPPHPPKDAAEAIAKFNAVADQWGATLGEIDDAKQDAKQAQADAKMAAVESAKAGRPTKISIIGVAEEHAAKIAELEAKAEALAVAVDEQGNAMAVAIAQNREEWLATLAGVAADAEGRYAKALADAQAALRDLTPARASVNWLQKFSATEARVGRQQQFSGGRLVVEARLPGSMTSEWSPKLLIEVAAKLLGPEPVARKPRTLTPAAESSRIAG